MTLLIIAIHFIDGVELEWIAGLWGTLIISIFIMISQIAQASSQITSNTKQLTTSKERLANEIKHRLWAEKSTSESKIRLQVVDENFPTLLAYFNVEQRCRYHNHTYRKWFGLNTNQIDGQFLHTFASEPFYASVKNYIKDILAGETVFHESLQKSAKGQSFVLAEQFIPHFDNKGKVIGFYTQYTPRSPEKCKVATTQNNTPNVKSDTNTPAIANNNNQTKQTSNSGVSASRIVQAIDDGEFSLYCQKIMPIKTDAESYEMYEILIRMAEEESNLMPPGAFLPFVEKYKMMSRLDCWVVSHMMQWLSAHKISSKSIFSVNVSKDTIKNTNFPKFVQERLQKTKIAANTICFEIEESDALSNPAETLRFAEQTRLLGCRIALCSFNHNRDSLDLLRKIKVDFIKIDGSLVWNILKDEEDLAKVVAINRIARTIKVQTIAELVETDDIIIKLRELGIDFAQGFGVARPQPLKVLE
ncbi:MAG: EAL domain-containing protein [Nitrosomonas sp.]|nr:EAL domain-containing protein [Nitrosomonas sp.]